MGAQNGLDFSGISIHAPRVGCDAFIKIQLVGAYLFQSTHPVWGATDFLNAKAIGALISIHAPRVGCDRLPLVAVKVGFEFQSTHPVWGATFGVILL